MTHNVTTTWQPTAQLNALQQRATMYAAIRHFFAQREVLEVETPVLSHHANTDVHIDSMQCHEWFLQTSPEFAMKRLLAAGTGSIYQICKAFRYEESGRWHNPEFSMLEWYRVGFTHLDLMQEVSELLQATLGCEAADTLTYQQAFLQYTGLDPLERENDQLRQWVVGREILASSPDDMSVDDLLNLVFSHCIEPELGRQRPVLVVGFPASQSALARINESDNRVADRFEAYFKGVELANGFFELSDSQEQRRRFEADNAHRLCAQKNTMPIDENLLAALESGLPSCAGVALGLDRLLMLATGAQHINEVIAFPIERA
ncbi:elongation factor P--(R)-beta-lysine ligase [Alteromonas facilis]|uniref:elongation factor P--(R)-beta-lysine ligase n=1 Tax=Alteromonas facilis TaxID=2048004 RepID=UPI000C28AF78|nr:elongation factor P--(R)-beta-lysine ligase [Alteromonas facilis]